MLIGVEARVKLSPAPPLHLCGICPSCPPDLMKLSIVIPCFHESAAVRQTWDRLSSALAAAAFTVPYEVIFVDDGSRDDTFVHLRAIAAAQPNVRVLKLSANVGSHMAIRAGLEHANGTHACYLPADLQEPPELLPQLLALCRDPVQIAWAVRDSRQDPWLTRLSASLFYTLARLFVTRNLPAGGAGTFLLGPKALAAVPRYTERNLTLEGLFATMGFPLAVLPYQRQARQQGASKWTLAKKLKLFADFFVAYSYTPLRFFSYLGLTVATCGFLYAAFILAARLWHGPAMLTGFTSIMIAVLILGGLQMVMMGVLGEYVWRALDESRGRPCYLIDEEVRHG
jgi:polyisoprenyl-phosphate glycosyltransferase